MKTFIYRKYSKLIYSIILSIMIFILFQIINPIHYDISDDMYIALFIKTGDWYFGFVNYFFCAFCGIIQNIIYPLNAYTCVIELLLVLSMISITNVFIKKYGYIFGTILILLFEAFFAVNYYSNVSFTKAPAIICMAGFILIFDSIKTRFYGLKVAYGIILVIVGSSIRFQIFEVVLVFVLGYIFLTSIQSILSNEKKDRKLRMFFKTFFEPRRILSIALAVLVAFVINFASGKIITSTDDLKYFNEYTAARSAVWDYPIPEYEVCPEEYDAIGIDKNDLEMLKFGYMDDEGAFSLSNLKAIKSLANKYIKDDRSFISVFYETVRSIVLNIYHFNEEGLAYLAFFLVAILFILINKKNRLLLPVAFLIISGMFYLYLHYIDRFPYRAVFVIWISAIFLLMYEFNVDYIKSFVNRVRSKSGVTIIISVLISFILISGNVFSIIMNTCYHSYVQVNEDKDFKLKEYISTHRGKYELPRFMGELSMTYNNVILSVDVPAKKYLKFMGTYYQSTYYKIQISIFGTDNMFSNLLNDDVYYVDKNGIDTQVMLMCKYLNKYYSNSSKINYKKIKDCGDYSIYKFYQKG